MKEIFITNLNELEELECKYTLEFCGYSGKYYNWLYFAGEEVSIYFQNEDN